MRRWRVHPGFYFVGAAAGLMMSVVWAFLGESPASLLHREAFEANTWRNQQYIEHDVMWPPRLRMVDDLMSTRRLDGLTKDQVLELLGKPEDKGFPAGAASCDIHYYLGPERGVLRIDSEWLFITLDDSGRVDRYWIYRD